MISHEIYSKYLEVKGKVVPVPN